MSHREVSEAFHQACADRGLPVTPVLLERTTAAAGDEHYGFVMQDNLGAATNLLERGGDPLPLEEVPAAMGTLATLLSASGEEYRRYHKTPAPNTWAKHVARVRAGKIALLPPTFWMTPWRGRLQAERANRALDVATTGVEHVLAALNYELYFRPETMAGAARTLARSPEIVATSKELEAMPHLSVANWTLGQTVQHVFEGMARQPKGKLEVVDMCSGTGATLAAITNRLSIASGQGYSLGPDRLAILGFEATPAFFEQLGADFLPNAQDQLQTLGITERTLVPAEEFDHTAQPGEMTLVEGDVVKEVEKVDFSGLSAEDMVVATANYGFHRLSARRKSAVIKNLATAPNSVICIGDLRQNGSAVNRGYFNLANNGPLNAGNINLETHMQRHGYRTYTIGVEGFDPAFIEPALRARLASELENDGFVTIAVKGQKAFDLIFASR